jgi:hypothetical protein
LGGIPAAGRIEARAWGFIAQRRYRNATGPVPPPPTLIRFMTRVPARAVPAIMAEAERAWRKKGEEKYGMPECQRVGGAVGLNLSTLSLVGLKRVAIFQIRSPRFSFLILRMSLSRNRCPLSGDML